MFRSILLGKALVLANIIVSSYIGTIVLMTVANTTLATKVGLLISYYITLSFWSAQTLTLSMVSRNIAGQTKKATVVAATFVSWAAGNAIGEWFIRDSFCNSNILITRDRSPGISRLGCATVSYCLECASCLLRLHDRGCDLFALSLNSAKQEER